MSHADTVGEKRRYQITGCLVLLTSMTVRIDMKAAMNAGANTI
jgi:hypothetical protein